VQLDSSREEEGGGALGSGSPGFAPMTADITIGNARAGDTLPAGATPAN